MYPEFQQNWPCPLRNNLFIFYWLICRKKNSLNTPMCMYVWILYINFISLWVYMCVYCACRSVILKLTRTCICACACIVRVDLLFYSLHAHENFWDTLYHYFPLIGRNFLHARACACDFVTKKSMLNNVPCQLLWKHFSFVNFWSFSDVVRV